MRSQNFSVTSTEDLKEKLDQETPNNEAKETGYALVNVLSENSFTVQHIPGSMNIPRGEEDTFEEKFDKSKEIIVYCASPQCQASPTVAGNLVQRGFTNVTDYEGGMSEWINAGFKTEGEASSEDKE